MTALIYKPAKTAMQSGQAKTDCWVLEYEQEKPLYVEPLMGWTSSADTKQQLKLKFETLEEAVDYCKRQNIVYHINTPHERKRLSKSYSENFKHNRKIPWTH